MSLAAVLLLTVLGVSTQLSSVDCCQDYWVSFGRHCYRYFGVHVSWREAEEICTGLGYAHLVSIHSHEEFNFVFQLWKELRDDIPNSDFPYQGLWIGLTDQVKEGVFTYTDGSPVDYLAFAYGEPNDSRGQEDFIHIWQGPESEMRPPYWNDARNELKFQVMCKQTC
ncbi:Alpha-N-acetylgalactosamine-specific lectin [Holothuria leucospilota]|uniref:Alpha-N-acetylgalactosamine-specific lectin n=1 Tax=Holothuria leucospilota TaxID=206669 RepID=A0A9Q1BIP1_HOLLE|nr:Alpha-N-acetylgalactosamine-specific lectin [Holothuria leucospilota]